MTGALVRLLLAGAAVVLAGVFLAGLVVPTPSKERDLAGLEGDVARGAYVARLSGCIACHTNAKAGGAVLGGGAPIKTDFGTFRAPNITPDETDGIGNWTLDDFSRALTEGRAPDGSHYYPSFPYPFYRRMSDQDIVDLWAAVRSVPPVEGGREGHDMRFPFNIRTALGFWKRLHLKPVSPGVQEDRGRYIVRGPGHCGACHTPRGLLGGRDPERRFAGAFGPDGEKTPPITADALIRAGWTADDLAYALRTGIKPDGDVFGGSMVEVVRDGSQYWSDADIAAVVDYLLRRPGT